MSSVTSVSIFPAPPNGFRGGLGVKNLPIMQKTQEDPLEEGMATHSSILACRIPWTGEPGGLQSMRSQRIRQPEATEHTQHMSNISRW